MQYSVKVVNVVPVTFTKMVKIKLMVIPYDHISTFNKVVLMKKYPSEGTVIQII